MGLIIMGNAAVHVTSPSEEYNLQCNVDDRIIPAYKKIVEGVHRHGAKIMAQLEPMRLRLERYVAQTGFFTAEVNRERQTVEAQIAKYNSQVAKAKLHGDLNLRNYESSMNTSRVSAEIGLAGGMFAAMLCGL
jgi:2,4-dienoyl-CoA reductase-like NADH-dependent reductase (Old Yellow Enzyme family)